MSNAEISMPSLEQMENELGRERYRRNYRRALSSTVSALIIVAAVAILISMLVMPVLQITGESMTPAMTNNEIVVALRGSSFEKGDIIAFYYNNKILVKRVIAQAGEWVDITKEGNVLVNGEIIEEPYVHNKAFGECDIELPYQVPEDRVFVMGDDRDVSIDSRNTSIGPIAKEQIVGRIIYRIWPFDKFGKFDNYSAETASPSEH